MYIFLFFVSKLNSDMSIKMSICTTCNKYKSVGNVKCFLCNDISENEDDPYTMFDVDNLSDFTRYMSDLHSNITWVMATDEHMKIIKEVITDNIVDWYKLLYGLTQHFPAIYFVKKQVDSLEFPSDMHKYIMMKKCIDLYVPFKKMFNMEDLIEINLGECPICLEDMNPDNSWSTMCCHNAIHNKCLQQCTKCPLCRGAHYTGMEIEEENDDMTYQFSYGPVAFHEHFARFNVSNGFNQEDSGDMEAQTRPILDDVEEQMERITSVIGEFIRSTSSGSSFINRAYNDSDNTLLNQPTHGTNYNNNNIRITSSTNGRTRDATSRYVIQEDSGDIHAEEPRIRTSDDTIEDYERSASNNILMMSHREALMRTFNGRRNETRSTLYNRRYEDGFNSNDDTLLNQPTYRTPRWIEGRTYRRENNMNRASLMTRVENNTHANPIPDDNRFLSNDMGINSLHNLIGINYQGNTRRDSAQTFEVTEEQEEENSESETEEESYMGAQTMYMQAPVTLGHTYYIRSMFGDLFPELALMEPAWNYHVPLQIYGRAIRNESHQMPINITFEEELNHVDSTISDEEVIARETARKKFREIIAALSRRTIDRVHLANNNGNILVNYSWRHANRYYALTRVTPSRRRTVFNRRQRQK